MEQKIIPIKIQVDNTEAEKAYQDLEKASQKMANNVSKNSKKANDSMVKDTQSATSKLTKHFKDLQKQVNKSIDVSKIGKQLSSLRSQIQSSLGNIVINAQANITTKEQGVNKPSNQSQVNQGLSGAIASGAILNNQLSQMHDKLENISKVEVAEVFKDTAPELEEVVKGVELIKEALYDIELGEGVELSEFAKSVEAQLESVRQAFETLITDKTKVSMADLKRELRDLEQTLFGLGVESEAVAKLTNELAKMSKARGLTKIGDMATDEEISSMKKAIGIAEELVSTATKGIDRVELFDGLEEDIAKLTALQSKLEETKKKADAIALGSATESFLNKISKTGYEVDNLNDLLATQNEIINSNTRLTNAQRDAMLQYSSSTIAGIKQIVAGQQAQVTSTNAVAQSQSKLATTMGKLKSSYQTVKDSLSQFKAKNDEWLKNHVKTTEGIKKANKGLELSFKSLLKAIVPFLSIGAIFTGLKTSINNAMDSIETASKFESIFGSEAQEMSKWINQLNKELGVNVTSMMDYTSTLYGMGINLGFTTDKAVQFSKDLGMLSQDMASFYNISSDDAFNKLRSYMAGSTEVLYDYGVVATEANLQTFALSQGITKAYSSMSQAEKSMLRYQFAMKGLSQANKDLENTLPSPANQARVLKESLNQLSVALGKCFIPILTVVLPILNTFTQALTRTINAVATFISSLFEVFGVKTDFGGSSGVVGAVEGMAGAIEGADIGSGGLADNLGSGASSAKEIAKFLGGIDELNIVTSKQDKGSGGGSGSGGSGSTGGITGGNIDTGAIDKGLDQVKTKLQQWAEKVANALKSVWGSLKDGWNSVDGYISSSLDKLKQSFSNLGQSIESFLIGCWNNGGEELIYNIGRLAGAFTGLAIDIGGQVINAVAKLFDHLNPDNNPHTRRFIEAMNEALVACQNFALSAGGWLQTFMDNGGQAFINNIGDIATIVGTTLVEAFEDGISSITDFLNSAEGQEAIKDFASALEDLSDKLEKLSKWVSDNISWLSALGGVLVGLRIGLKLGAKAIQAVSLAFQGWGWISGLVSALAGVFSWLWGTILVPIGSAIMAGLGAIAAFFGVSVGVVIAVIASVIAVGVLLWKNWDWICEKAGQFKDWVSKKWTEVKEWVVKKTKEMVEGIKQWWNDLKTNTVNKFNEIKTSITNKWNEIKTSVTNKVIEIKNNIVNKWTEIKTNVINKVVDIKDGIKNKFTEAYNNVTTIFTNIKTSISDKITEAKDAVWRAIEKIKGFFNFKWSLPKLKLPHFKIDGEFSLMPPKVPKFKVDWYSSGGIFTQRTILGGIGVGDANKGVGNNAEAVLPLDVLWDKLDRKFANQNKQLISALSNTDQPVILQLNLDGEVLAKKQFKTYKDLTRRRVVDFTELV